jgi:hypothetical protein
MQLRCGACGKLVDSPPAWGGCGFPCPECGKDVGWTTRTPQEPLPLPPVAPPGYGFRNPSSAGEGEDGGLPGEANSAPASKPRPMRRVLLIAGLSCVSAVLIAGGFVCLQRARQETLETNAIGSCRTYANAQVMYHKNDWDGHGIAYARPFTELWAPLESYGARIQLIDAAFRFATTPSSPKHGYWFKDMETISGRPIDWTKDFALCAMPATYGKTGRRTLIVSTDGTVWAKDRGRSEFVADFPADPLKEGWRLVE